MSDITLILTYDEARVLKKILVNIGGPSSGPRQHIDSVLRKFPPGLQHADCLLQSGLNSKTIDTRRHDWFLWPNP